VQQLHHILQPRIQYTLRVEALGQFGFALVAGGVELGKVEAGLKWLPTERNIGSDLTWQKAFLFCTALEQAICPAKVTCPNGPHSASEIRNVSTTQMSYIPLPQLDTWLITSSSISRKFDTCTKVYSPPNMSSSLSGVGLVRCCEYPATGPTGFLSAPPSNLNGSSVTVRDLRIDSALGVAARLWHQPLQIRLWSFTGAAFLRVSLQSSTSAILERLPSTEVHGAFAFCLCELLIALLCPTRFLNSFIFVPLDFPSSEVCREVR
jgi:hypothetical protein